MARAAAKNPTQNPTGADRLARTGRAPGNPGNTGGKKGRSGRKPKAWTDFCSDTVTDPDFQQAIRTAALNGDMTAAKMLAEYGAGKPKQTHEVSGPGGGAIPHRVAVEFVTPEPAAA